MDSAAPIYKVGGLYNRLSAVQTTAISYSGGSRCTNFLEIVQKRVSMYPGNSFEAYICYYFTNSLIDLSKHFNPYLVAGYTPIVIPFSVQTNMKTILQSVAKLMRAENVSLPNLDDGYRENKRKF